MAKTYITFGQIHVHSVDGKTFDKDCVAVVNLPEEKARAVFWPKFHNSYTEEQFDPEIMQYYPRGLIELGASVNGEAENE